MPNRVHTVEPGDSFTSLSIKFFGEDSRAGDIRAQNSVGTLVPGTLVTIPPSEDDQIEGIEPVGISVKIDGVLFRHFTSVSLTRTIDAVDTVEIVGPLADTPEFRAAFRPFSFADLSVSVDGVRLFRGTMVNAPPKVSSEGSSVTIAGYSLPGVLHDCMVSPSSYPLQFRRMNIADMADKLVSPFGITVARVGDMGGPFGRIRIKRDRTIMSFLHKRAHDRGLLIRSNPAGELVLAAPPVVSAPIASLDESKMPVTQVQAEFDPQRYFSRVTGVRATRRGFRGAQHTVVNQRALEEGIHRPFTISIKNTKRGELARATLAAAGRVLANAVSYTVSTVSWKDPQGDAWEPGATVELLAPRAFVEEPYNFQIRAVKYDFSSANGTTADLHLVLPGAFGGEAPDVIPWG